MTIFEHLLSPSKLKWCERFIKQNMERYFQ